MEDLEYNGVNRIYELLKKTVVVRVSFDLKTFERLCSEYITMGWRPLMAGTYETLSKSGYEMILVKENRTKQNEVCPYCERSIYDIRPIHEEVNSHFIGFEFTCDNCGYNRFETH